MQIICTSLQTDNHEPCQHLITQFFTGQVLFLTPHQHCQCTVGKVLPIKTCFRKGSVGELTQPGVKAGKNNNRFMAIVQCNLC